MAMYLVWPLLITCDGCTDVNTRCKQDESSKHSFYQRSLTTYPLFWLWFKMSGLWVAFLLRLHDGRSLRLQQRMIFKCHFNHLQHNGDRRITEHQRLNPVISFFITWRANHLQPWHRWFSALGRESPTNWLSVLQWSRWPLCIWQFGSHAQKTSPSVEHLCQCQCKGPSEWGSHWPMRKTEKQRVRFLDLTNEGPFLFCVCCDFKKCPHHECLGQTEMTRNIVKMTIIT